MPILIPLDADTRQLAEAGIRERDYGKQILAVQIQELRQSITNGQKLDELTKLLQSQGAAIMAKLDELQAAVAAENAVIQSAILLINGLAQAVKDAGTDPDKLAAVVADIEANKQALADAVAANTPAA